MLTIKNLSKKYGDLTALKNISLDFEPGKTTVILGPSGSGKSTLLRCLNLLEEPEEGALTLGDLSVNFAQKIPHTVIAQLRKHSSMVFQDFQLFPHLRAIENITLGPVSTKLMKSKDAHFYAQELLERVGLADRGDSFPSQLSGGQQQRIAIARALAMDPDYLLCDEPTSALDPELENEVLTVLKELAQEHRSMIVVTHNMHFAEEAADRILFMESGQISFDGTAENFFKAPTVRIKHFLNIYDTRSEEPAQSLRIKINHKGAQL